MSQFVLSQCVPKMEALLQEEYHAEKIAPVDYILYNARQQVLNLFYSEAMGKIMEESGFSPEMGEEESLHFDEMVERFDREEAKSEYLQYRFAKQAPDSAKVIFYVTIEKNTGFVLAQYEWDEEAEQPDEVTDEDYRFFNIILKDILLAPYGWVENLQDYPETYERFTITKEFWDSVC